MAKIQWDQVGERFYETGISQGVLYKSDGYGVPWNGLTSIDENTVPTAEPIWFDGFKYNDVVTLNEFSGVLRAFTYPDEFLEYQGIFEDQTGFHVTNQPLQHFSLSYRSEVSNDVSDRAGYKIHILYNLLALPSQTTRETLSTQNNPIMFEWNLTAIPEDVEHFRPTAHAIIDSRDIDPKLLIDLESMLYGDEDSEARLPTLSDLSTFIRNWDRLVITDLGNGMWEAHSPLPEVLVMLNETTFQIISDTAEYIDEDTYTISSSQKNEEEITLWQP